MNWLMNEQMRIYANNQLAPRDGFISLGEKFEKTIEEINTFSFKEFSAEEYSDFKVAVYPLLRVLLKDSYDLSTNDTLSFKFKPSNLNLKNRRKIIKPYVPKDKYVREIISQYGESIEKHLKRFVNLMENEMNIKTSSVGTEKREKKYIPYNDWLVFAIVFIYYDGRPFEDKYANMNLPHFIKRNSCSRLSYRLALRTLSEFIYISDFKNASNEEIKFAVAQLQRIDKIFNFFRINKMNTVRKNLITSEFLKEIYDSLDLEYEEVINLVNIFDEEVFKNDEFIDACFKFDYLDPLFVFEYFFKYYMFKNKCFSINDNYLYEEELNENNQEIIETSESKMNLKDLITVSKEDTLKYIKIICTEAKGCNQYEPEPKDSIFLRDYYFDNMKSLIYYSRKGNSEITEESEYLEYLFNKFIVSLPQI